MSKFDWKVLDRNYEDVIYETYNGIAKITINRPQVRNAFRPKTVMELIDAFTVAREDNEVGVIVLTGANHGQGEDKEAFCSGGDQSVRGHGGYVGEDNVPRLNVLDLQRLIRVIPKPVIAMVNGFAIGGGHVLHIVCDLTIASENAKFGQTGPRVGSFDAGYGAGYLARMTVINALAKYGSCAVNTQLLKPMKWAWLTVLYHSTNWKKKQFNGVTKFLNCPQWHCVC